MNQRTLTHWLAALSLCAPVLASPALADDQIFVPLFTYRTGAYAGSGIPVADGIHDYLTMLNERDGGIGGVKLLVEECETGYDAKKGLECYDSIKGKNPVVINPWSTGITLPLIPKASVDRIPIISMAYGLSASAIGNTFPWVFNPPATYWDGASMILKYIGTEVGGMEKLKGKKIGYIYLDAGFGKEPIPFLQQISKDLGFDLTLYPVAGSEMQNQSSQWLNVRRDKPDYMIMYGWGAMQPTAVKEAAKTGFPMDKFISIWWPGEDDLRSAGDGGKGFKELNWHATGANFPVHQDIIKFVVDKGLSKTSKDKVGENLYNRGLYNSLLIAESIRNAQKITGKKLITAEDMRRGIEALDITDTRLKDAGLEGFTAPFKLTCADHNGHRPTFVQQWDGTKWVKVSGLIEPMSDKVQPLLEEAAKDYVTKNAPWPARSETCDKAS